MKMNGNGTLHQVKVIYTQSIVICDAQKLRARCKPEYEREGLEYRPDDLADLAVWALQSADPPLDYGVEVHDWHAEMAA
jgi:hypothetical protein